MRLQGSATRVTKKKKSKKSKKDKEKDEALARAAGAMEL